MEERLLVRLTEIERAFNDRLDAIERKVVAPTPVRDKCGEHVRAAFDAFRVSDFPTLVDSVSSNVAAVMERRETDLSDASDLLREQRKKLSTVAGGLTGLVQKIPVAVEKLVETLVREEVKKQGATLVQEEVSRQLTDLRAEVQLQLNGLTDSLRENLPAIIQSALDQQDIQTKLYECVAESAGGLIKRLVEDAARDMQRMSETGKLPLLLPTP